MAKRRSPGGASAQTVHDTRRREAMAAGWARVREHPVMWRLAREAVLSDAPAEQPGGWARVTSVGRVDADPYRDGRPDEWAWVFTHLLLHLGLGHLAPERLREAGITPGEPIPQAYAAACCVAVERFAQEAFRLGTPLVHLPELPGGDELALAARWSVEGVPHALRGLGPNSPRPCLCYIPEPSRRDPSLGPWDTDWPQLFARGLAESAQAAMQKANARVGGAGRKAASGPWDRALGWFVSSYPLLGAVAAGLTIVDDPEVARAWDISIAAVSPRAGEIYINPRARLTEREWRFVLAHEMLHAALGHDRRVAGRDPELFNVACDFVINDWLIHMGVGDMPEGLLYDPQLHGLSAEEVYDTLVTDLRRARKLDTLAGRTHGGKTGDVLGDWLCDTQAADRRGSRSRDRRQAERRDRRDRKGTAAPAAPWDRPGAPRDAVDLDAFYRRALATGLEYHDSARGLVPAGLIEEIRALEHPPLAWDVRLARWFDEHVRSPEHRRSFARASRRQAASPDIPRPGRHLPEEIAARCTFGVVLDTSGSMEPELLGKALGAIASYAAARDVPRARVVFCDAAAYDAGYMAVEDIAGSVRVRGRGGTVLQPGVDLLQRAEDFPADGPVLVITDGYCDRVVVRREHAFLVPRGARLPFTPRGPVFHIA
ncbi:vWA domain-containing protein [Yinghuangia sp. YIM S10712]|uniref:vWA domain-containing protein n=1 Tax=Yinghuangia sp. YIM S10712 TaxID=3436930 RepID=UPI003F52A7DB